MDESLNQERIEPAFLLIEPRRSIATLLSFVRAHAATILAAALLAIMAAQMLAVVARKSITNDEILHIPAGYYHLVGGDFQLNNEHPPLAKMWAALPLLLIQPNEDLPPEAERQGNSIDLTWSYHQRFWASNRDRAETIQFWTRAMMIVLSIALGALIYVYARDLFGTPAALFAVACFTLEPT